MTDPTGRCSDDPLCEGDWTETTGEPDGGAKSIQDHFNFGDGSDFTYDPADFGDLEGELDIGTELERAARGNDPSAFKSALEESASCGCAVDFRQRLRFNKTLGDQLQPSGRILGRFQATVTGKVTSKDDGS